MDSNAKMVLNSMGDLIDYVESLERRIDKLESTLTTIANMQPSTTDMKAVAFNTTQELVRKALGGGES